MSAKSRMGPVEKPPTIHVGDLTITLLDGGHLRLDGGAMLELFRSRCGRGRPNAMR
ncbi:MAG: hypothetical protein IPK83_05455 [Planctomycetes bacterium]|nr:hypothetical protein [Planctomycetota bacterium]